MAKGQRKSNREAKKPKMTAAEKSKIASLSSSRPGFRHCVAGRHQKGRKVPCLIRLRGAKRTRISRDVNLTFGQEQILGDRRADFAGWFGGSWTGY